jgi:hypothetical protein
MGRVVKVLMVVLLLGQAVEMVAGGEDACAAGCEDGADGKQCPPVCPTCSCVPHVSPMMVVSSDGVAVLPAAAGRDGFDEAQRTPVSPEPHEILHVPRSLLA